MTDKKIIFLLVENPDFQILFRAIMEVLIDTGSTSECTL